VRTSDVSLRRGTRAQFRNGVTFEAQSPDSPFRDEQPVRLVASAVQLAVTGAMR
jgi:hypothetical protein